MDQRESDGIGQTMTKEEGEAEAVRRWRMLPLHDRATCEDAEAYAERLVRELDFFTVTDRKRLIAAWLMRDMFRMREQFAADSPKSAAA
jgi:hypothetical protein